METGSPPSGGSRSIIAGIRPLGLSLRNSALNCSPRVMLTGNTVYGSPHSSSITDIFQPFGVGAKYSSIMTGSCLKRSGGLLDAGKREPGLLEPPLEHRNSVIAPELLATENADWHAEDLVGRSFLLGLLIVALTIAVEISPIIFAGESELIHEFRHGFDFVDGQFAPEEQFVDAAAVIDDLTVFVGDQAANQRRGRVIDLERPSDNLLVGPLVCRPPGVHIGVLNLVFGVDASLS